MYNKLFFLCNKEKEPDRYVHLMDQNQKVNLQNYDFFNYIWADQITNEIRTKYCKTNYSMQLHGRVNPLSAGELSLVLNYIECLKKIRQEYSNGVFILMESDVIFGNDFTVKFNDLLSAIQTMTMEWDILNIGNTKPWMNKIKHYKNKPVIINNIQFTKEPTNRCAEAIVWNYNSVCKFLDYFEKNEDINGPIDTIMDVFSEFVGGFNIYWNEPSFITQGSINGRFKTILR